MKVALALAATAMSVFGATAAQAAATVTSIKITNNSGVADSYIQIAELQVFSNGVNIASQGTASAFSTYSDQHPEANTSAARAIDGLTAGVYTQDNFYHSAGTGSDEYFNLAFSAPQSIEKLTIFGRSDCCQARDSYAYTLYNGTAVVGSGTLDARANRIVSVATPAVPEPATWAMLILGMGVVGFAMRRRQKVSTKVAFG